MKEALTVDFYEKCQEWWADFKQIGIDYQNRIVKIYGEDEDGLHQLVCNFIEPISNIKGLDTPLHCLRFVSLIPHHAVERPGGE